MKNHGSTIRYLGYRNLPDGSREYDFSFAQGTAKTTIVSIDTPIVFFRGPNQIAIQEAAGICYETLKFRFQTDEVTPPERFDLTAADIAQHRRSAKDRGGRR